MRGIEGDAVKLTFSFTLFYCYPRPAPRWAADVFHYCYLKYQLMPSVMRSLAQTGKRSEICTHKKKKRGEVKTH